MKPSFLSHFLEKLGFEEKVANAIAQSVRSEMPMHANVLTTFCTTFFTQITDKEMKFMKVMAHFDGPFGAHDYNFLANVTNGCSDVYSFDAKFVEDTIDKFHSLSLLSVCPRKDKQFFLDSSSVKNTIHGDNRFSTKYHMHKVVNIIVNSTNILGF
jgi:hypothetical protein